MKKYVVTGGTGFIGSNIVEHISKDPNNKVLVLDNNFRGNLKKIKNKKNIYFKKVDIRDRAKIFKILKGHDAVIHLAYINGTENFYKMPCEILDVAIHGLMNIVDGCKYNKIKELYLASSSEVYNIPEKIPTSEDSAILKIPDLYNPRYTYGGGKILTELVGINYGKKFFNKLIIFRPHNVYGPDMGNEHVIPQFINRLKNKSRKKTSTFLIQGTGKEIRSFIYIDDFIRAFDCLLKKGKHNNIYNIGTTKKINMKKLALLISKIMKKKIKLSHKKLLIGSTHIRCPDINKIKKIGFKPLTSLQKGLNKTINWYV